MRKLDPQGSLEVDYYEGVCGTCRHRPATYGVTIGQVTDAERAWIRGFEESAQRHTRHTTRALLKTTLLEDLAERFCISPITKVFGQWAVTEYGLECLTAPYTIPSSRLHEDWQRHMSSKKWVLLDDFTDALAAARTVFAVQLKPWPEHRAAPEVQRSTRIRVARSRPLRLRFQVFKRDGYRCQICGASAADNVRLEIDHKVPRAKGGLDELRNLWTLCFPCNRGKGTEDL